VPRLRRDHPVPVLLAAPGPGRHGGGREGYALLDPVGEDLDVPGGQLARRRHLQAALLAQGLEQDAPVGVAGRDGRAEVAALEEPLPGGEAEPAADLLAGAVALVTVLLEDWQYLLLVEGHLLGGEARGGLGRLLLGRRCARAGEQAGQEKEGEGSAGKHRGRV